VTALATNRPPPRVVTSMWRVFEREAMVFRRLWRGSVFSSFVTPVLFLAAMGVGVGGLVKEHTGAVGGVSYLQFVAPGLMAASAMQVAAGQSMWTVLAGAKWTRFFHGVVATPVTAAELYGGFVSWIAARTAIQGSAFGLAAVAFGGVPSLWGVLAVPAVVLGALAFAAPLTAFAATQETDVAFAVVFRIIVMPLFLFSGTFFPVHQLPHWLRPASWFSPLWHAVELARGATTGSLGLGAALAHVSILLAFIGVGAWWGTRTFVRRLTP
jgi:lipooligosaccharide transport system permease protein